ncbi:MAG: DUF3370 domain-containing protein [Oscillatoriaceae bacterium SKW80]|nr:DUF3370 domain-containing protein [Oscillatoriaceae bacterium SKYG93]MCX8120222.1 DUF3370 domain-containing protein [Oscillatoriaceae bacterium SKW80]MDW8453148.1 DUF3370 domain-containing protein [Oscillatoriaceae cyanobacterium SKYGB_i_bin93]HIK28940.1 DUF3370 domain-containing protein [Oscillatoriaceae cyanobacterium M7585_C2015_266]
MLPFLSTLFLIQATPNPPQEIVKPQEVRPLPGQLDAVPMFNSNSPELVLKEGILLSTFPPEGKKFPAAHLNFPFSGRFDLFAHHVAKAEPPENLQTLYLGVIVHNPGRVPVKLDILQAVSYLSQPDAPFIELPAMVENPDGRVYAGPGSRATNDILRGLTQAEWPAQLLIPPGNSQMLMNLPIPVRELTPPLNGRSTIMRLRSNGKVYMASLAMFAKQNPDGSERAPTLEEWQQLLETGDLSTPRDKTPTPLDAVSNFIYGRVAGVARGSVWKAQLVDRPGSFDLTIPQPGEAFSYGLSTLVRGTLGTNQVQSAPMLVRYPDTAYQAHGNYAIEYNLTLPLSNPTPQPQTVTIAIQTPIKEDQLSQPGLRFFAPPPQQVFFRGTVRISYNDDWGIPRTRYFHLVQRRGQQGEPLVQLNLPPGSRRLVAVDFVYPPDATPPQVLTVETLKR